MRKKSSSLKEFLIVSKETLSSADFLSMFIVGLVFIYLVVGIFINLYVQEVGVDGIFHMELVPNVLNLALPVGGIWFILSFLTRTIINDADNRMTK